MVQALHFVKVCAFLGSEGMFTVMQNPCHRSRAFPSARFLFSKNPRELLRRPHRFPCSFLMSCQESVPLLPTTAVWNAPSMIGGTPLVFTDVQFEANTSPGAGIIAAGLLENEFRIVSNSEPDSHMNKLRTDCLGCSAVRESLSVLLKYTGVTPDYLTARYHDYASRRLQRSIEQTLYHHEISLGINLRPACPA